MTPGTAVTKVPRRTGQPLVPGALGLIGFTQLGGNDPSAGVTSFVDALVSILSIALGILTGLRALRIAQSAAASARHMARP